MTRRVGDHLDGLQSSELRQFLLHILGADPGSPVEGQFWYHNPTDTFRFRTATATLILGRLDQISAPTADVSMASQKLTNLAAGTAAGDAVNLTQLQDAIAGLNWKDSVRASSTTNVTLATAVENGDAFGGVTLATGDRVALTGQTAPAENGIYTVNASGAPTRATDADSATDIRAATFFVEEGTNAGTLWTLTTDPPITLNTTGLTFAQFGASTSYTAGGGIGLSGSTLSVAAGTGLTQDVDGLSLTTPVTVANGGTNASSATAARVSLNVPGIYATSIGNNSASTFSVTHNLNTLDVIVQVYDISSGLEEETSVNRTGVNAVSIDFSYVPATTSKRVVVLGQG